jgi:hypothetical protein
MKAKFFIEFVSRLGLRSLLWGGAARSTYS